MYPVKDLGIIRASSSSINAHEPNVIALPSAALCVQFLFIWPFGRSLFFLIDVIFSRHSSFLS